MTEQIQTSKKIYSGIDLFKLISSLLILLLHAVETTEWYACEIKFVCTRFAVPFFFITSGFFFYKGLSCAENKKTYFWRYEKNVAKLYLVWALIIYLPFEIVSYINMNQGANPIKIVLLLIRRFFIIGAGPYWYLLALMLSVAFLYVIYRTQKDVLLLFFIILGLILGGIYSCFHGALSDIVPFNLLFKTTYFVFSWEFNFIMYGIPFMGMGYFVAKKKWMMSVKISALVLIISFLLRIVEYNLPQLFPGDFWSDNHISFAFIIQAFAFFMLAKELQINIDASVSLTMRQLSSFIYFLHAIILYEVVNPVLSGITSWPIYDGWFIPIKMIMVLIPCVLLFAIIKKVNNKYLNILING